MKKLLAAAAILSIAAFAGCSANNNNSADSSSEAVSDTSSASSESTSDTTSESSSDAESETAPAESGTSEDTSDENVSESRATEYAEAALGAAQWPDMELITEETADAAYYSFMGIDLSLCEDYYVALPYTSVDLARIVIVKPSEGNEETVKSQVDSHFDYIKTSAADYPTQEAVVDGSVSGETADGYYYIFVSENGSAAADAVAAMEV